MASASQTLPTSLQTNPNQTVQDSLNYFLNPNSQYMQNARQQGVEYAASRGGLNSSIAAGASQKAAMDAVQPLVNNSLAIQTARDNLVGQNWLDTQGFNRQFQGALAMLPITSSYHMLDTLQQYSLQDPSLYPPDVISGYSNFFTNNMNDIMKNYFGTNTPTVPSAAAGGGGY